MANARRVTESEALGAEPTEERDTLSKKYAPAAYLDVRIPETRLDDIRLDAYFGSTYRSSHEEDQVTQAVDRAISERVQRAAQSALDQSHELLAAEGVAQTAGPRRRSPNTFAKADAHLAELAAIRAELRSGKTPTAALAERYERVKNAVQNRDGHSLVVLSKKATSLRDKVADPKAAVAKTLSIMPLSAWRPLGIRNY